MSHIKMTSEQIAQNLIDECVDKRLRLAKVEVLLAKRLAKSQQTRKELDKITSDAKLYLRYSNNHEWIEGERERNAEAVSLLPSINARYNLTAPPHLYQSLVDLCDALLAEQSAAV